MPIRIQLSRAKGFRLPPNTLSVARPTRWGNPFDVREYGLDLSLQLYESLLTGWSPSNVAELDDPTAETVYALHCAWLRRIGGSPREWARSELRGKNLACWCPLLAEPDQCHASILLRVANEGAM